MYKPKEKITRDNQFDSIRYIMWHKPGDLSTFQILKILQHDIETKKILIKVDVSKNREHTHPNEIGKEVWINYQDVFYTNCYTIDFANYNIIWFNLNDDQV